jgi:monovalent cation:H+ antiporter, CPA1 family
MTVTPLSYTPTPIGQLDTFGQVQTTVILLVVTLVVALISRRFRLPYTLILVFVGLVIGFLPILTQVHLDPEVVLFLFLPLLLFEGAWNVEIEQLTANWLPIVLLAVPGLVLSLLLVAVVVHWGIGLPWLVALLLGAMVSPTDPVAVISLLRQLGMPDRLRTIIEGESLFNDGVGAAAFTLILAFLLPSLGLARTSQALSFWSTLGIGLWLMLGGLLLGLVVGWLVVHILRFVDDHLIEMTVTLSVAYGVYLLGLALQTSGLLAVVGAGLVMGSYGRQTGLSERAQQSTNDIWEFLGYIANSFLFLLLGIQIGESNLFPALPGIGWVLLAVVVGRVLMTYLFLPLHDVFARRVPSSQERMLRVLPLPRPVPRVWRPLIVLSGLRGALSIALVLSLPKFAQRGLLATIVYGVVLVTLLGQGLGLRILLPHWPKGEKELG